MKVFLRATDWVAGLQWLLFMFTNTVVIPITVGAAFRLGQQQIAGLMQLSFVLVGVACVAQGLMGHRRPIMEGQSGLWWAVILSLAFSAPAQGISLTMLGGSLATGILISAAVTVLVGVTGAGSLIAKLFNPGVMGVFMFLFGVKLIAIFARGMLGLPFGEHHGDAAIVPSVALVSILLAILVAAVTLKAPSWLARYALLIGVAIGWAAYVLLFRPTIPSAPNASMRFEAFPLGAPAWNSGIVAVAIITGLLNLANTFGALKGSEPALKICTSRKEYRASLAVSGVFVGLAGLSGLVPFAPYVSSIGFLDQTRILERAPFILGGLMFVVIGVIPPVGHFFSLLPLSIGGAVLFVPYLLLLNSSLDFFRRIRLDASNIYRAAAPLFVGLVIMTMPATAFASIPAIIRPLMSSGLLVGIILALLLENLVNWDRCGREG